MKVLLDTNVLLSCVGPRNSLRPIWNSFLDNQFELILTTEIFFEYIEVLQENTSVAYTETVIEVIRTSDAVVVIRDWHRWNLIYIDPDDNKFLDVAISANADYIVTDDKHFNFIKPFPFYPKIISPEDFLQILETL